MRNVRRIIWHHTAGSTLAGALSTLQQRGLHYHALIESNGNIHRMRDFNLVAFHAGNANSDSIGIAFVGNFLNTRPTNAQLESARNLAIEIMDIYGELQFLNHRDVSATLCPVIDLATKVKELVITKRGNKGECCIEENVTEEVDLERLAEWQKVAIERAVELGISDGSNPLREATRVEIMAMCVRTFDLAENTLSGMLNNIVKTTKKESKNDKDGEVKK